MFKRPNPTPQNCRVAWILCSAFLACGILVSRSYADDRLTASHYKSGPATKRAFRELMSVSNRGTVKILAEDKPVALGVIMTSDGEILSKASELKGDVVCELWDGRTFPAKVVATHGESDLALLKISTTNLRVLEWDSGPRPDVGQWLVTPGLKELPVSVGIVSVAERTVPPDRGVLGVSIEDQEDGPRITKIFPNSGAAKAGLKVGDIVTNVAGQVVKTGTSLSERIGSLRPGDSLKLFVLRDEKEIELLATLGYPEGNMSKMFNRGAFQNRLGGKLSMRRAGFTSVIQHDSVLAPEECGGPLIGLTGKALGLNIARGGRTESYALPAKTVVEIHETLRAEHLAAKSEDKKD